MKIPILINIESEKRGRTFVRLCHDEENNLRGASITIRGTDSKGIIDGDIQTKLAHELGHIIAELFEKRPKGLKEEITAWEWAVETGVEIQKWAARKALGGYIQSKEDIKTIKLYLKEKT